MTDARGGEAGKAMKIHSDTVGAACLLLAILSVDAYALARILGMCS